MATARQVKVTDLKPGMVTPDWIVVGEPYEARMPDGAEETCTVVRMRHRADGGESDIYYDLGQEVTVIEFWDR